MLSPILVHFYFLVKEEIFRIAFCPWIPDVIDLHLPAFFSFPVIASLTNFVTLSLFRNGSRSKGCRGDLSSYSFLSPFSLVLLIAFLSF